jgi:hypothetical protein
MRAEWPWIVQLCVFMVVCIEEIMSSILPILATSATPQGGRSLGITTSGGPCAAARAVSSGNKNRMAGKNIIMMIGLGRALQSLEYRGGGASAACNNASTGGNERRVAPHSFFTHHTSGSMRHTVPVPQQCHGLCSYRASY